MTHPGVALVLAAGVPACRDAAAALFPAVPCEVLTREDLRPPAPFDGPLFDVLAQQPAGSTLALVTPVLATAAANGPADGDLVPVADHVNLEPYGPLTGRWPAEVPRDFPGVAGIYQPSLVRPLRGARVYSSGVVAAGVADARRLTRFEARAIREGGWPIVSDSLVPVAIVAAYYGVKLAACGVVQAPLSERE